MTVRTRTHGQFEAAPAAHDVSSGTSARFCRLDAEGRARVKVPAGHPAATVSIVRIRPNGGRWRLARGSITVGR